MVESKVKGEKIEVAPEPKPRGQVIDLMEALKKSLAGKVARPEKKQEPVAERAPLLSFNEFKEVFAALDVPEQSLRKSYQSLDSLRKNENLSWHEVRNTVQTLRSNLEREALRSTGKLKAARIPLTERDWAESSTDSRPGISGSAESLPYREPHAFSVEASNSRR